MKTLSKIAVALVITLFLFACAGNSGTKGRNNDVSSDTTDTTPDSIVSYFSNQKLLKEVSFKNGVRNGLTRTFYPGGQLYQTFIYRNDVREDSSGWYYLEGQLYRSTPYVHDTIHGIQRQYYRDGKKRARIGFDKGLRTGLFEEYTKDGKRVNDYPEIVVTVKDDYNKNGRYTLTLALSDNSQKVRFYKGDFTGEKYDTSKYDIIKVIDGKGSLVLRKSASGGKNYVGIVGDILTGFGNRYLTYKKIDLPYNDLE